MKEQLKIAIRMTVVTTLLLGVVYPMAITGLAQLLFPDQANGQIIELKGILAGSRIIGQPFTGPGYFQSRPSAAGGGYDALASGGSNLGPTNRKLVERVTNDAQKWNAEHPGGRVPIDLVTASGSGLDPHISPAAAEFQIPRVARARGLTEGELREIVRQHTEGRTFGVLGEPRVNVVMLNLDLDATRPPR